MVDPRADRLSAAARSEDPLAFVADPEVFGDLAADDRFTACFRELRAAVADVGMREAAAKVLGD